MRAARPGSIKTVLALDARARTADYREFPSLTAAARGLRFRSSVRPRFAIGTARLPCQRLVFSNVANTTRDLCRVLLVFSWRAFETELGDVNANRDVVGAKVHELSGFTASARKSNIHIVALKLSRLARQARGTLRRPGKMFRHIAATI
jgi:hypothetical protein